MRPCSVPQCLQTDQIYQLRPGLQPGRVCSKQLSMDASELELTEHLVELISCWTLAVRQHTECYMLQRSISTLNMAWLCLSCKVHCAIQVQHADRDLHHTLRSRLGLANGFGAASASVAAFGLSSLALPALAAAAASTAADTTAHIKAKRPCVV